MIWQRQFTHWFWGFLLLWLGLLLGCSQSVGQEPLLPTAIPSQATPTLANSLAQQTLPPQPGITPLPTDVPSTATPTVSPSPTLSPTPTETATPTPMPAQWLDQANLYLHNQQYDLAITAYQASLTGEITLEQQQQALYGLGKAFMETGQQVEAAQTFNQYLSQAAAPDPLSPAAAGTFQHPQAAAFWLAELYRQQGDCPAAIGSYQVYLDANPEMGAYILPIIADCYLLLEDRVAALTALEAASQNNAHRLTLVPLHNRLATLYLEDGNFPEAVRHYDAILNIAITEQTKGQTLFLAGAAELRAGNPEAAHKRFLQAIQEYPRSADSYQALLFLVEAEVPIDDFQRGLVDYYAAAYLPAITAFEQHIAHNLETYRAETHLFLAWCYEGIGDLPNALNQLDKYAQIFPPRALIEKAKLYQSFADLPNAIDSYLTYLSSYPDGEEATLAAWAAAQLTEQSGDTITAISRYQEMATNYSWHTDAPEALFHAGWLAWQMEDVVTAQAIWSEVVESFPQTEYAAAALLWLIRILPADSLNLDSFRLRAQSLTGNSYYVLRAKEIAQGLSPFVPAQSLLLPDPTSGQTEAENWLGSWYGSSGDLTQLSPLLLRDETFQRAAKLWELGFYAPAQNEFDNLRATYQKDGLLTYQLAVWLGNAGIYRESILAAFTVYDLSGQQLFDLPPHLLHLLYPTYYADLILPLAQQHGYDSLLQFALIRQESLFNSFATSSAVAQGLSQVIPDTGAYIAQKLNWTNYQNSDLYKPYIGLTFGAYYLAEQLHTFDNNVPAALSAYNAGPGNALRWYNQAGNDLDTYLETVDFAETRLYIERIYIGYTLYQQLYSSTTP